MKINFDSVISLLASDTFKKDLEKIISNGRGKKCMDDVLCPAIVFLALAICADEKGMVKINLKELKSFVNGKINYLTCLIQKIIPEARIRELLNGSACLRKNKA